MCGVVAWYSTGINAITTKMAANVHVMKAAGPWRDIKRIMVEPIRSATIPHVTEIKQGGAWFIIFVRSMFYWLQLSAKPNYCGCCDDMKVCNSAPIPPLPPPPDSGIVPGPPGRSPPSMDCIVLTSIPMDPSFRDAPSC